MQNANVSVADKEVLLASCFHMELEKEVKVAFYVDDDEFCFKIFVTSQKGPHEELSSKGVYIDLQNDDGNLAWNIVIANFHKGRTSFSSGQPAVFASGSEQDLSFCIDLRRVEGSPTCLLCLTVFRDGVCNG